MKVKLLKKLRKQIELKQRNGKFKVFDNSEYLGGIYYQTDFISKTYAIKTRREWILIAARKYLVYKKK
jgi:hypothetical protein